MLTLDSTANFSWDFGHTFFLETEHGLYEWSDPDYGGDNTIRKSQYSSIEEYWEKHQLPVRSKGYHTVGGYCGPDVIIVL